MPNNTNGTITRLDIVVENDSYESLCSGAKKVISRVKNWKSDSIAFKLFKEGFTNHLLKCYVKDRKEEAILIRVYGQNTELFIDRDAEVRNMQIMCNAGLNEPLYCAFTNGLCYGFSPGDVLDIQMVRDPDISGLIAGKLAHMHSLRPKVSGVHPQPCLFTTLSKYLELLPTSFSNPEKDAKFKKYIPPRHVLEAEINAYKEHLISLESPVVFCHNDLLLKNVIFNQEKNEVTFIDFEYSDYNYQAFDIGNHFCEFAGVEGFDPKLYPEKDFQMRWLRNYLESWYLEKEWDLDDITDGTVEHLYIQVNKFALAPHLLWGTWALIQAAHSVHDLDYIGYSKVKLDEYFARKDEFLSL